jgi:hypothetical protein
MYNFALPFWSCFYCPKIISHLNIGIQNALVAIFLWCMIPSEGWSRKFQSGIRQSLLTVTVSTLTVTPFTFEEEIDLIRFDSRADDWLWNDERKLQKMKINVKNSLTVATNSMSLWKKIIDSVTCMKSQKLNDGDDGDIDNKRRQNTSYIIKDGRRNVY